MPLSFAHDPAAPPRSGAPEFNRFLLDLYRLAQESPIDAFQDAALGLLRGLLPFDSSMWGTATNTERGIDIHTIHLHEQPVEMLQSYEQVKHLDTAAQAAGQGRGRVLGFNARHWFDRPEQAPILAHGVRHRQANVFIASDYDPSTRFVHWLTLFRADERARCTSAETALLTVLSPHVMQALTLNRIAHLGRREATEPVGRAAAIGDARGVLSHVDPRFLALLAAEWARPDGTRVDRLPAPLVAHFQRGETTWTGHATVVTRRLEHGLLFLRARPRVAADDLTPRERVVAELAAGGHTHKEIARRVGRAPATVRNQIRSVYQKLGVTHVAGLIEALRAAR